MFGDLNAIDRLTHMNVGVQTGNVGKEARWVTDTILKKSLNTYSKHIFQSHEIFPLRTK